MKNTKPKTYWNTRVVYNETTKQIGFKEVYYKKDKIDSYTKEFIPASKIEIHHLISAVNKPIMIEFENELVVRKKLIDGEKLNNGMLEACAGELTFEKLQSDSLRQTLREVEVLLQNKTPGKLVLQVVKNGLERANIEKLIHYNKIGQGSDKFTK